MRNKDVSDTIVISTLAIFSLLIVLSIFSIFIPSSNIENDFILPFFHKSLFPENKERLLYTMGVVLTPFILIGVSLLFNKYSKKINLPERLILFFSIVGYLFLLIGLKKTKFTLLKGSILFEAPLVSIVILLFFFVGKKLIHRQNISLPKLAKSSKAKLVSLTVALTILFVSIAHLSLNFNIIKTLVICITSG